MLNNIKSQSNSKISLDKIECHIVYTDISVNQVKITPITNNTITIQLQDIEFEISLDLKLAQYMSQKTINRIDLTEKIKLVNQLGL